MDNTRVLPSEKLQKEFERNPLKLLEEIQIEENSTKDFEDESKQEETNQNAVINPQENGDINNIYNPNLNCSNLLNDCNSYRNSNDNKNIFVNNIIFNFKGKEENKSDENNYEYNIVNNSHCLSKDVSINAKEINCINICNDNISINKSFLKNNLSNNFAKNVNVNNKHINISKLLYNLKTYKGSIYAQSLLERIDNQRELNSFFNDIIPNIREIMCSEYGNYFFQKLIKK